jgi:hypothetical protein
MANNYFGHHRLVITNYKQHINLVTMSLGKLYVAHMRSNDWQVFRGSPYRNLLLFAIKVVLVSRTY